MQFNLKGELDLGKVIKFPQKTAPKTKLEVGPRSVSCIISNRWLALAEKSDMICGEEVFFLDVMTKDLRDNDRKICTLCISKEELLKAVGNVKLNIEF
jgi:hypothetical protein